MLSQLESRTVPERALVSTGANLNEIERALSIAGAAAFAIASFALARRALTGHSRLYAAIGVATRSPEYRELTSTTATVTKQPQRTVTVLASLEEIELFFLDPPRINGLDLGRDIEIDFTFHPRRVGGETELQGRLIRGGDDRTLRDYLRAAKQLIETGEIARTDERVHGRRSRWELRL